MDEHDKKEKEIIRKIIKNFPDLTVNFQQNE